MSDLAVGGQALIEGVMMRDKDKLALAVRKPDGKIVVKTQRIRHWMRRSRIFRLPFLRGILMLGENLVLGYRALSYSADQATGEKEKLGRAQMIITLALSIVFAVVLFIGVPFYITTLISKDNILVFNIIDGLMRLMIFLAYLVSISLIGEVKRVFQYHGAEHMTIHAYEKKKRLEIREIRPFPTAHPRCGTSFLMIVLVLSIVIFSFVITDSLLIRFLSRIVLIPVIAGVSYEVLKLSAKFGQNPVMKLVTLPGLWLQLITTKRPDGKKIEVAIAALKALNSMK